MENKTDMFAPTPGAFEPSGFFDGKKEDKKEDAQEIVDEAEEKEEAD